MIITKNASDNAKAVAIVMVMVGHLISSNKTTLPPYFQEFATFSVGVFLFLSGYGLVKSFESNGLNGFLSKRFLSVYIPFVLATLVTSIYRDAYTENPLEILYTVTFLSSQLKIDPTMWFVYFICIWYISFYLIFKTTKNNIARFSALLFISFILSHLPSKSYSYVLHSMFSLHAFAFPLGVFCALFIKANKNQMMLSAMVLILAFSLCFYNISQLNDRHLIMIASLIFCVTLPMVLSLTQIKTQALTFLGAYSYEIYLFEGIFRWDNFSGNKITNAVIFFITAITLAYAFKPISIFTQNLIAKRLLSGRA